MTAQMQKALTSSRWLHNVSGRAHHHLAYRMTVRPHRYAIQVHSNGALLAGLKSEAIVSEYGLARSQDDLAIGDRDNRRGAQARVHPCEVNCVV